MHFVFQLLNYLMSSVQIHYPKNHRFKLRIGTTLFLGSILVYFVILCIFLFFLDLENYQPNLGIIAMKVIASLMPFTGLMGLLILGTTTSKIVTSSRGIELHQFGCCAKTTWDNINKIASFKSGTVSGYALYLNQPVREFLRLFPSITLANATMIPLGKYRFNEESSLGRELRRFKPEIF